MYKPCCRQACIISNFKHMKIYLANRPDRTEKLTSTTAAFDSVPMRRGPANGRNQSEKKKIRKAQPDTINHSRRRDCRDKPTRVSTRLTIMPKT